MTVVTSAAGATDVQILRLNNIDTSILVLLNDIAFVMMNTRE